MLNGTFLARAAQGQAGTIAITSPSGGNISGTPTFDASITGTSGAGGRVDLETGSGNNNNLSISLPYIKLAGGSEEQSRRGTIYLQANGTIFVTDAELLLGSITAYANDVNISTEQGAENNLSITSVGAFNGDVEIASTNAVLNVVASSASTPSILASGDISLQGTAITLAAGASSGTDWVQAENISLTTTSDTSADIQIGADLRSDGHISLSTGPKGSVINAGGRIMPVIDGADTSLEITVQDGAIGDLADLAPLNTQVGYLTASAVGTGGIYIKNETNYEEGLTLDTIESAGSVSIESNTTIKLISNVQVSETGDIELVVDKGTLLVSFNSKVQVAEGLINLHTLDTSDDSLVFLQFGAHVEAYSDENTGNIYIYRGNFPPSQNAGTNPGNVLDATHNGGQIFFGNPTITADGANLLCADGALIVFQAAGNEEKIRIDTTLIVAERGGNACTQ